MKIKPVIRGPKNYVDYAELKDGDTFIWHSELYMKMTDCGDHEQMAVCLNDGEWIYDVCSEDVLPVDAVITWTKQKE